MNLEDALSGVQRADPAELKPLKLHLPLGHVLTLHKMRIVASRSVSEIVAEALETYFDELRKERLEAPLQH
ncbi:MAG: hypothetical protein HYT80_01275 [Euryarchaeota archaeon]|nr:hypothetical protein [Euryarchaeota archaeon]